MNVRRSYELQQFAARSCTKLFWVQAPNAEAQYDRQPMFQDHCDRPKSHAVLTKRPERIYRRASVRGVTWTQSHTSISFGINWDQLGNMLDSLIDGCMGATTSLSYSIIFFHGYAVPADGFTYLRRFTIVKSPIFRELCAWCRSDT